MTYLRAFSMVVVLVTAAVVMGAVAVTTATAPPARGDPPITEGAGGGTGTGGGVEPPGGITDAPPPEVPNTDGSWTATVGGTEFAGLTEADVGRVLWRGERVNVTYEDGEGMVQSASVCEGFPAIELSSASSVADASSQSISVDLDFGACRVSVLSVERNAFSAAGDPGHSNAAFPLAAVPVRALRSLPIALHSNWRDNGDSVRPLPRCPSASASTTRATELRGRFLGAEGSGIALTEAMLWRCYGTESLVTTYRRSDCDTESPAFLAGVFWFEDSCSGNADHTYAGHARATTTGDFHAFRAVPWGEHWHHNISLELIGNHHYESHSCVISPQSIDGTRLFGVLTATFNCAHDTQVR